MAQRAQHRGVDLLLGGHTGLKRLDAGVLPRDQEPVDDESGPVLGDHARLTQGSKEFQSRFVRPVGGVATVGHLDELHQRRRVAVMGAHHAFAQSRARRDAGDRQRRGVGVEQRRRRHDVVEPTERLLLQRQILEDGLHHHVARCQILELGAAREAVLGGLPCGRIELAESDALVEEPVDGVDTAFEVRLVDVIQDGAMPGAGHHGGDARPHGPGPEDRHGLAVRCTDLAHLMSPIDVSGRSGRRR